MCCLTYFGRSVHATVVAVMLSFVFAICCQLSKDRAEVDGGSVFPWVCKRAEDFCVVLYSVL